MSLVYFHRNAIEITITRNRSQSSIQDFKNIGVFSWKPPEPLRTIDNLLRCDNLVTGCIKGISLHIALS